MKDRLTPFLWRLLFGAIIITIGDMLKADELDDLFGPDIPASQMVPADAPADDPAPREHPKLDPMLQPIIAPALRDIPLPPTLTPVQFETLRAQLTASALRPEVLTNTGLVVLCPPLFRGSLLASLDYWLGIMTDANITMLPAYAQGTPAWIEHRRLSSNPKTPRAAWVRFFQSCAS
jgi:hypothetical protein